MESIIVTPLVSWGWPTRVTTFLTHYWVSKISFTACIRRISLHYQKVRAKYNTNQMKNNKTSIERIVSLCNSIILWSGHNEKIWPPRFTTLLCSGFFVHLHKKNAAKYSCRISKISHVNINFHTWIYYFTCEIHSLTIWDMKFWTG